MCFKLSLVTFLFLKVIEFVINKKRKEILEAEIDKIGVPFKFYEVQCDDGPSKTQWTRLDGNYYYYVHNIKSKAPNYAHFLRCCFHFRKGSSEDTAQSRLKAHL